MRRLLTGLLILLLGGTPGCVAGDLRLAKADVPRVSADPAGAEAAAAAINAFGIELYNQVAASPGNLVVSPASIALALGMARAGARGSTANEMDAVLHDLASDANAGWLNALDAALATRSGTFKDDSGKDQPVTLRIANSLFSQQGLKLLDSYLATLASRYGAGVRLVDYRANPEAARTAINRWVSQQTEQRIPELLVKGVITADVRLTLVNAIYLKAAWLVPFVEAVTADGSFTRTDGSLVTVPFMNRQATLRYGEGEGWQAVELPYVGGQLAMTMIVPGSLADLEVELTPARFQAITDGLAERDVTLAMPRFGIERKLRLEDVLAALGMPTAFGGAADFSGITDEAALQISDVINQANIDVDEKGTTAAAATAVVMRESLPPPGVTVRLDRPFLFALRDLPTGTVLFLGRVADPSAR